MPRGCLESLEARVMWDQKDHADFKAPQVLLGRLDPLDLVESPALEGLQELLV